MVDWNYPQLTSTYTDVLDELKARDTIAARMFRDETPAGLAVGSMRWNPAATRLQEWDGSAWVDVVLSLGGGGTGASTQAGARSNLGLGTAATQSDTRYAHRSNNLSDLASAQTGRVNLGLGTAAEADLTTSQTDTTPGRALKVGDFGLGLSEGERAIINNDVNNSIPTGFYYAAGADNRFLGTNGGLIHVHNYTSDYAAQIAISQSGSPQLGIRTKQNGPWFPWRALDSFPSGTRMVFYQSSAPPGWTQITSINDRVLRVVSGSGGGSGGNWSLSGVSIGGTSLTVAQMPPHRHRLIKSASTSVSSTSLGSNEFAHRANNPGNNAQYALHGTTGGDATLGLSSQEGSGSAHSHGISNSSWRPSYIDVIVAEKD